MSKTIFYRVQNEEGFGPYRNNGINSDALDRMAARHTDFTHPTPWNDGYLMFNFDQSSHVCGFDTLDGAIEWFDGFGDVLDRFGFKLYAYEIESHALIRGNIQSATTFYELIDENLVCVQSLCGV